MTYASFERLEQTKEGRSPSFSGCLCLLLLVPMLSLADKTQKISVKPQRVDQGFGEIALSFLHSTDGDGLDLTGVGFRVHYDSLALRDVRLNKVLAQGLLTFGDLEDEYDEDFDPRTDRYIIIGWMDINNAGWPGSREGLLFEFLAQKVGETYLNISETAVSSGYTFVADNVVLK